MLGWQQNYLLFYIALAGYPASLGRKGGMKGGGERERWRGREGEGEDDGGRGNLTQPTPGVISHHM